MNKITCLSTVVASVLAVGINTASAGQSTVSAGYAQGDFQGLVNKANGVNVKYRYELSNSALGAIGSFTYLEKNGSANGFYNKAQYNSISAGPAYRINDWASLYGVVGVGYGKFTSNAQKGANNYSNNGYGFTYGAGVQINPTQSVALDLSYEQNRIRDVTVGAWMVGAGYRF